MRPPSFPKQKKKGMVPILFTIEHPITPENRKKGT